MTQFRPTPPDYEPVQTCPAPEDGRELQADGFQSLLGRSGYILVGVGDLFAGPAHGADQSLHRRGEPREVDPPVNVHQVGVHRYPAVVRSADHPLEEVFELRPAVRGETHDLVLVAVGLEAEMLRDGAVIDAGGVRERRPGDPA